MDSIHEAMINLDRWLAENDKKNSAFFDALRDPLMIKEEVKINRGEQEPTSTGLPPVFDKIVRWPIDNPASFIGAGGVAATSPLWGSGIGKRLYNAALSPDHYWLGGAMDDGIVTSGSPINKVGAYLKALGKLSYPTTMMGDLPGFNFMAADSSVPEGHWEQYANKLEDGSYGLAGEDVAQTKTIEGQPHELAYITPEEAELLKAHGGAGVDSDDDGIKEYFSLPSWDDFKSGVNDFFGGNNPANANNNNGNFFGADTWTYGADDKGEGGYEFQTVEKAKEDGNITPTTYNNFTGKGDYRPDGTPRDSNDDVVYNTGANTGTGTTTPVANNYNLSDLDNLYGGYADTLSQSDMYNTPNLGSTIGGINTGIGTLSGLSGYDNQENIQALLDNYKLLRGDYKGLENSYVDAVVTARGQADEYEKAVKSAMLGFDDYTIQDMDDVKKLKNTLESLQLDRDYDKTIDPRMNLLASQGMFDLEDSFADDMSGALGKINALTGQYDSAVSDFKGGIDNLGLGNLLTTAQGLDLLGDMEGTQSTLDSYKGNIEDLGNISGLSNNQLDDIFASSGYTGDINDIQDAINKAVGAKTTELGRISDAEADALSLAQAVQGNVGSSGYYSQAVLDQLKKSIDEGKAKYSDFSSVLDYDFKPSTDIFSSAQSSLDELTANRKKEIDSIEDALTQAYSPFSNLELQEESEFNKIKQALGDVDYDLGYFSGGRVGDLYNTLDSYQDNITSKLGELDTKREGIETSAQTALEDLLASDYGRDNYEKYKGIFDPIGAEIEKFGAKRAYDERDDITAELARRLGLVEADEKAVESRLAAANADLNDYQFSDYKLVDPLSTLNTGYGLYNEDEEEEDEFGNLNSAFYKNIIKV